MVADASELGHVVSFRAKKDEASTAVVKFYISSAELDAKSLLTAASLRLRAHSRTSY